MDRWFISLIEYNNYLYWITEIGGHFMRMDLHNNKVEYMQPEIDGSIDERGLSAVLCRWRNSLFFTVNRGNEILEYDLADNHVKTIKINCGNMNLNMFSYAGVVNGKLIIVPIYHYEIVQIDLEKKTYERVNILDIKEKREGMVQYYAQNSFTSGSFLELFSTMSNEIVTVDLTNMSIVSKKTLPFMESQIINYIHFGEGLILLDNFNQLYQYENFRSYFLCKLSNVDKGYFSMCIVGSKLWMFPVYDDKIIEISLTDGTIREAEELEGICYTAPSCMGKYTAYCKSGNRIYYAMHSGTEIVYLEEEGAHIHQVEWPNIEEDYKEIRYQKRKVLNEIEVPLSIFLNCV